MKYTINRNEFEDSRHFFQWIKTITETKQSVEEISKTFARWAWDKLEREGEITINPSLWYSN